MERIMPEDSVIVDGEITIDKSISNIIRKFSLTITNKPNGSL